MEDKQVDSITTKDDSVSKLAGSMIEPKLTKGEDALPDSTPVPKLAKSRVQVILAQYESIIGKFSELNASMSNYVAMRKYLLACYYRLKKEKPGSEHPEMRKAFEGMQDYWTPPIVTLMKRVSGIKLYCRYRMQLLAESLITAKIKGIGTNILNMCRQLRITRSEEDLIVSLSEQNIKFLTSPNPMSSIISLANDDVFELCTTELKECQRELSALKKKLEDLSRKYCDYLTF